MRVGHGRALPLQCATGRCALLRSTARRLLTTAVAVVVTACDGTDVITPKSEPRPEFIQINGSRHWTDWSEYTSGVQPTGFSQVWDPSPHFKVVSDSVGGNKLLEWSSLTGVSRNRFGLAYDGAGDMTDQSVYTEFRVRSMSGASGAWYMGAAAVRMGGTAAAEGGYAAWFFASSTQRSVALSTFVNGGYQQLAIHNLSWTDDTWYSVRLEAIGTALRLKVWPRGTPEPQAWQIDITHTAWPVGKPGVANHDNAVVQWDHWEVNGTAAPVPPPPPPAGVTSLFMDFTQGAPGVPVGWTETSVPANSDWAITNDPTASDGRVLRNTTTLEGRHILRLDAVPDTGSVQEVVVKVRSDRLHTRGPGIVLRHRMNGTADNGYLATISSVDDHVEIARVVNGTRVRLGTGSFANNQGNWYWIRFRADGSTLMVKVWNDGAAEPANWRFQLTDATHASGGVGIMVHDESTVDFDQIGYASGARTAPSAPPPPPALTQLFLSPASVTLAVGASTTFTTQGLLSNGSTSNPPVTFSATGGTITAGGVYTAGSTPGMYQVIATHQGTPALADTSIVTIDPPQPGVTLVNHFTADAIGTQPAGWTETAYPNASAWTVTADAGVSDGRVLRNVTTGTGRHILRLDAAGDTTTTQEIVVRMRMADADGRGPGVAVRHTMSGSLESAYVAYFRPNNGTVEVNRFMNGNWLFVGQANFPNQPGQWYWMRFRAEGNALKVKVWNDAAVEPAAWTFQGSDSGLAAGAAGLYTYEPNTVDYDGVGFAAGGATAPLPMNGAPPVKTLVSVVVTPPSASVVVGGVAQFNVYGRWNDNDSTTVPVTWQATGGTITAAGLFTAGNTPGTYQVIATHTTAALADTSMVTVTAAPSVPPAGSVFSTGFSTDAPGAQPAGWTATAFPTNSTWQIVDDNTASDGRILRNRTTATGRHILRFDAVADTTTTQEVLVKMRMGDADNRGPGIAVRHVMNGTKETAYVAYLRPGMNVVEINRFLDGNWLFVGSAPFVNTPGNWYWIRFRAEGTTLSVKVWTDGTAEPAAWSHVANDAGIAAGSLGLYTYESNTVDYDQFGYGIHGAAALRPTLLNAVVR